MHDCYDMNWKFMVTCAIVTDEVYLLTIYINSHLLPCCWLFYYYCSRMGIFLYKFSVSHAIWLNSFQFPYLPMTAVTIFSHNVHFIITLWTYEFPASNSAAIQGKLLSLSALASSSNKSANSCFNCLTTTSSLLLPVLILPWRRWV
jgi:hypothetical protein